MLLNKVGAVNALSKEIRQKVEERVKSFGKSVQYEFAIKMPNPDPQKEDGEYVWPRMYNLTPVTFELQDTVDGMPQAVRVGLIKKLNDKADGVGQFHKITLFDNNRGVLNIDLTTAEGFARACFIEMHPKNADGLFPSENAHKLISRIDIKKFNIEKREERSLKVKALNEAMALSDLEIKKFGLAMRWEPTLDISDLRAMVEDMAENEPQYFFEMKDEKLEYLSEIEEALRAGTISYDPVNNTFKWKNGRVIVGVPENATMSENEWLGQYFKTGGDEAKAVYEKLKKLK